jgi:antitoxin (DNA-binding transcriptional repressor) of toxin-antitoxin stability system
MVPRETEEADTMRLDVRNWRRRLPMAIKAVKAGQEVVLIERGEPIGVITPVENARLEAALRRMEAARLLIRATKAGPMPPFRPFRIKGESTTKTLRRMRDEG